MAILNKMIIVVVILVFCTTIYLEGFSLNRIKRDARQDILTRIATVGNLNFTTPVLPEAIQHRKISCFFIFDKEASAELQNDIDLATAYATQTALLASKYMASVNTVVTVAGTEIWANMDRISLSIGDDPYLAMPNFVTQIQDYLNATQSANFGKNYSNCVFISNKPIVQGGYSQGPPCNTQAVSLINYRPIPWSIGGLVAHELAHTLSVVHPFELSYLCESETTTLEFCKTPNSLPRNCTCDSTDSTALRPEQCLMTFQFGLAQVYAPKFTTCDIQMMNYFSSNIPCLIK